MDYSISWGGDPEDVCIAMSGVAQADDLGAFTEAIADPRWHGGMKVLLDYREVDWAGVSATEIETRARLLKGLADEIGQGRVAECVAVVVEGEENYHVQRLIMLRLDWNVGFTARIFTSLPQAREWLHQPADVGFPHASPRP